MTVIFLTTVFMMRNLAEHDCVLLVEGNRGTVMFGMSLLLISTFCLVLQTTAVYFDVIFSHN